MKKILFSAVVSSFLLLLIGCQDNSMTNPVSSQSLNKTDPIGSNFVENVIPLDYKLIDPVNKDIEYKLSGDISYTEEVLKSGTQDVAPQYAIKLDNSILANLKIISSSDIKLNSWKISSQADNIVKITSDNADILVKSFPVIGNPDRLELVCTFTVSADGEELTKVALESPVVKLTTTDG
jgi:hypothetical protein